MKTKRNDGGPRQSGENGRKRNSGSGAGGAGGRRGTGSGKREAAGAKGVELPSGAALLATVIVCLQDAGKRDEARLASLCCLELGRVRAVDGDHCNVDVTVLARLDVLRRLTTMSCFDDEAEGLKRVRKALNLSLPAGYQVGRLEARVTPVTGGGRCVGASVGGGRCGGAAVGGGPAGGGKWEAASGKGRAEGGEKEEAENGELKSGSGAKGQKVDGERCVGVAPGTGKAGRPAFMFRKAGSHWDVAVNGGEVFHLDDMLGARYLNRLLHQPNQAMWASELELALMPARAGARTKGMAQEYVDPKAAMEYLRRLEVLRAEREKASDDGDGGRAAALDAEIEELESQTKGKRSWADAGEKSRNNVRHAIGAVIARLARGTESEKAFAKHLQESVSLGFRVMYKQPLGRIWK